MSRSELYEQRIKRFNLAFRRQTPDRVPIIFLSEMWPVHYCGLSPSDVLNNPLLFFEAFEKTFSDIYVDGLYGLGNLWIEPLFKALSNTGSYVLKDGIINYETRNSVFMNISDYDSLIKNPRNFILNRFFPKKFEVLKNGDSTSFNALNQAFEIFNDYRNKNKELITKTEQILSLPVLTDIGTCFGPDMLHDFFRGFQGVITDIYRHPQLFLEASAVLTAFVAEIKMKSYPTPGDGHYVFIPLHFGTCLKPKDFETFYLPFLIQVLDIYCQAGYTVCLFLESDWTPYLDYIQEFPDGNIVGIFEYGDLKEIKKRVGNRICVAGGMPISLLSYGTRQHCLDKAKRIIDDCAPGGGFIFATDKILLSLNDGQYENIKAVHEFVHDYAKY
nr:uroporphyrinogen decarboxylase family protein [uncultured Acetobacterium sp.]